jgi:hypothetical protein
VVDVEKLFVLNDVSVDTADPDNEVSVIMGIVYLLLRVCTFNSVLDVERGKSWLLTKNNSSTES